MEHADILWMLYAERRKDLLAEAETYRLARLAAGSRQPYGKYLLGIAANTFRRFVPKPRREVVIRRSGLNNPLELQVSNNCPDSG